MKVGALGGGCPWPCVLPLALGAARCVGLCSAGLGAAAMARLIQRYWDIPDGAECHRKAYASTSNTGALGLITSAYSVALQPPDSFLEGGARTGRYTFTAAAIGAVLGIASCVSARVRQKPDDPLNYFIGGCAGDLTLGARTHSYGMGAAACADMGIAGVVKMGQLEGWELFAEPKV